VWYSWRLTGHWSRNLLLIGKQWQITLLKRKVCFIIFLHAYLSVFFTYLDKHPFNGLCSRTTWESRHQKGSKTNLDFNEGRDDRVIAARAVLYANHLHLAAASTSSINFYRPYAFPDSKVSKLLCIATIVSCNELALHLYLMYMFGTIMYILFVG